MDILDEKILYKMVLSRDKRFDGQFYIAVKTTKIYCRPTCPARPLRKNMLFFKSQASAEVEGFRPCLRCRPDLSPHSSQWDGTKASVNRAIRLIENSSDEFPTVTELADKLGFSERHLRRLFQEHLGASPQDIILSKKLHLARQLLSQTSFPITEIAFASGFRSLRRFNDAFKKTYQSNPSSYRKENSKKTPKTRLEIPVLPPFNWQGQLRFFARHQMDGIEFIEDDKYYRTFSIGDHTGFLEVSYKAPIITVTIHTDSIKPVPAINERIRRLFDLNMNPEFIELQANSDPVINLWMENKGTRIPGSFDTFETAVSIILGQAVSIKQANRFSSKLVRTFGNKININNQKLAYAFPTAADLKEADLETIGITKARASAIRSLASAVLNGSICLDSHSQVDDLRKSLLNLKGIGPWTTSLILMRCLNFANAVPENDLFIKKLIQDSKVNPDHWVPWGSYLTVTAWNNYKELMGEQS